MQIYLREHEVEEALVGIVLLLKFFFFVLLLLLLSATARGRLWPPSHFFTVS
jgi:hypothetical protein